MSPSMSFNIAFDYRFDTSGFFTATARDALEAAADAWESRIRDAFTEVPAGIAFTFKSPSRAPREETVVLTEPIDDVRIFVGAQDPPFGDSRGNALAEAVVRGFDTPGDVLQRRIANDFRGDGPVTDFEPFLGTISVDPTVNWSFDPDGPGSQALDFRSVMAHEIGHVLGIGQAQIFRDIGADGSFDGPNALRVNGGEPVPLTGDASHTLASFRDGATLMAPTFRKGERQAITEIDEALLADIGYEIDGFTAQGTQPEITTDGGDGTIQGTVLADRIDARGGDERLQGEAGDDTLLGGAGADTILGQAGRDVIRGGPGNDKVQGGVGNDLLRAGPGDTDFMFGNGSGTTPETGDVDTFYVGPGDARVSIQDDFDLDTETIVIDPRLGFDSVDAVLDTAFAIRNGSRIDLRTADGQGPVVDIIHEPASTTPLTADNIAIQRLAAVTDDASGGSGGADPSGGGGDADPPSPPDGPPVDTVASAFLHAGQGVTVADPLRVVGRAGGDEAVVLDSGAAGIRADANIERFDFPQSLDSTHFAVTDRGLEIAADGDRLVTIPSLNQPTSLRFPGGDATLTQVAATRFELAGGDGGTATLDRRGGDGASVDLGDATSRAKAGAPPDDGVAATVFLKPDATVTARDPSAVFGTAAGTERVRLAAETAGVRLDANVERIDVPQPLADLTFGMTGDGLEIGTDADRPLVTLPSLNQPMAVHVDDGAGTLTQTGASTFTLAGADDATVEIDGAPRPVRIDLDDPGTEPVGALGLPPATGPDPIA